MGKRLKSIKKRGRGAINRFKVPNNNLFIAALIFFILFLFIEVVSRIYNLYTTIPYIDIPTHFFAGLALGLGIFWVLSLNKVKTKKCMTLLYTLIIAAVWEILEILEEMIVVNPPPLRDFFFWDGFWDIIVALIGAVVALGLIYFIKKNTNIFWELK